MQERMRGRAGAPGVPERERGVARGEAAGGGWALRRGAVDLWRRFRASAARVPRAAWVRWGVALGIGALLCAALMAALTLLARDLQERGMQAWDRAVLLRIEKLPFPFDAAVWWEAYGASSVLIPLVATALVVAVRAERPVLAANLLASFLLAKPIFGVGWRMWDRDRPDLIAGGVAAPSLHSFPSGHAMQTAAIYGLLLYLWLRRSGSALERVLGVAAWLALVVVVGVARLRMGAHWPSDVIAGSLVGVAWLVALLVALRRGEAAGGR